MDDPLFAWKCNPNSNDIPPVANNTPINNSTSSFLPRISTQVCIAEPGPSVMTFTPQGIPNEVKKASPPPPSCYCIGC